MEKTKKLRSICNIILLVVGVLAAIACLIFAMGDESKTGMLSFSMSLLYVMIGAAIALILLFLIIQVLSDKKQLIRFGLLVAIAIVIVLIAYLAASPELSEKALKLEVSESVYKWSGALLNMAYILLAGVIAAFFGTIIYSKLKK